jgi:Flp pilus assembly protein TadG
MHNLIRDRRGVSAFATLIALTPLIGVVAFGTEAGSWYVTKQVAQNSADAAAYSGALTLACTIAGSSCTDGHAVAYRGKELAAQNAFCNAGDKTSYPNSLCSTSLHKGISQSVAIDIGDYSGGTFTTPPASTGNAVRAKVSQTQPAYLSAILGLTNVTVGGHAIAQVQNPKQLCGLGLDPTQSSLWVGGSLTLAGNGCGLQSDGSVKYSSTPTVTGSGWALYGVTGCVGSSGECSSPGVASNYYMPPATDPLSKLNSESFNSMTGNASTCKFNANTTTCTLTPNPAGPAYGNLTVNNGDTLTFTSGGTYIFYNAAIKIVGGNVTGSNINIVMLGNSSLSMSGGAVVHLSANANNTTYPDLNGVLFDDQAPNAAKNAVTVNGGGTVELDGASYFPNVAVSWSGTTSATNNTCAEVIANTLTMTGNAYMSTSNCAPGTIAKSQVIALVQ